MKEIINGLVCYSDRRLQYLGAYNKNKYSGRRRRNITQKSPMISRVPERGCRVNSSE